MPAKPSPYARKFAGFLQMIASTTLSGVDAVLIHNPRGLDDNNAELIKSLNRLAQAGPAPRTVPSD